MGGFYCQRSFPLKTLRAGYEGCNVWPSEATGGNQRTMSQKVLRALAVFGYALLASGCVTGREAPGSDVAAVSDNGCSRLTDERRKLAVQIDGIESGRVAPGTFTSALMAVGMLNAPAYQMGLLQDRMSRDRVEVVGAMRAKQAALSGQIDEKQCTAAARAKAGAIKATTSTQEDGTYSGRGQTDSWCAQPFVELELTSGRASGTLRSDSNGSETYHVRGQLYADGALSLEFMRPKSPSYTDDFDGSLKDGVLSFTAKLDLSPKACAYRFAVKRRG